MNFEDVRVVAMWEYDPNVAKYRVPLTNIKSFYSIFHGQCDRVGRDLGVLVKKHHPCVDVFVAKGASMSNPNIVNSKGDLYINHYTTIVVEEDQVISLDATSPAYFPGKDVVVASAPDIKGLMEILSEFYTGEWSLREVYFPDRKHFVHMSTGAIFDQSDKLDKVTN
jgi:hypothetical protein